MFRLPDNASIGEYTISRFIKKGLLNDTYVIRDEKGIPFFMKAFILDRISGSADAASVRITALPCCTRLPISR